LVRSLLLPACTHSIYSPSTSLSLYHTHMQCESHTSPMARYRLPSLSEDSEDSEQKEPAEEEEEEESSLSRSSSGEKKANILPRRVLALVIMKISVGRGEPVGLRLWE